jgi:hypothetical protein
LFPVALELASWFNQSFEAPWSVRTPTGKPWLPEVAFDAPQIWVPNDGAVTVLGKLGRRLAYLPTEARPDGPPPADPALVRFGRHLQFLAGHAGTPGQQLVIAAATIAGENWVTEQTVAERANLMAIDAWIDPPGGLHGFDAAVAVEDLSAGPLPSPVTEHDVADLIESFNEARRSDDRARMQRVLHDQRALYEDLTEPVWSTTWRTIERERLWPEEPRFVGRRWAADREAYSQHMAWLLGPAEGRRRTRQTVRQAIRTRAVAEQTKELVEAEEAISDPVRMIPYLLDHKAIEGTVVSYDGHNKEVKPGNVRATQVPILILRTERRCLVPRGKELWWALQPDRVRAAVHDVHPDPKGPGSIVTLKVMEHLADAAPLATTTDPVCFSQLSTKRPWSGSVPNQVPWTHRVPDLSGDGSLEVEADS